MYFVMYPYISNLCGDATTVLRAIGPVGHSFTMTGVGVGVGVEASLGCLVSVLVMVSGSPLNNHSYILLSRYFIG